MIVERAPPAEVYVCERNRTSATIARSIHFSFRIRAPKNLIIEYEQPRAHHEQVIIDEGVFRADPNSHNATSTIG